MLRTTMAALALMLATTMGASSAAAADFDFAFDGSNGGTVTGTIFGLPTMGTARPTSVTVQYGGFSYTGPGDGVFGTGFTTSNGIVTGADYQTFLNNGPANLNLGQAGFNQLITATREVVLNGGGFAAIRFTAVTAAVPEPATWAMMLFGPGAAGTALRRRRRTAFAG